MIRLRQPLLDTHRMNPLGLPREILQQRCCGASSRAMLSPVVISRRVSKASGRIWGESRLLLCSHDLIMDGHCFRTSRSWQGNNTQMRSVQR